MLYVTKKTIDDFKDKMSKDQYDKITVAQKKLEDVMTGEDVARIRAETENLKKALEELGGSMYQQAGAGPGMGGGPGNQGPGGEGPSGEKGYEHVKKGKKKGSGDDVVEGEYEKVDK
jgi:molecular chaperone DnaK